MEEILIEVDCDKFNEFLISSIPEHHVDAHNFIYYLTVKKLHKLDSFQKAYINQILENYYGVHYMAPQNENYILSVTNKKLCAFFRIKYGL